MTSVVAAFTVAPVLGQEKAAARAATQAASETSSSGHSESADEQLWHEIQRLSNATPPESVTGIDRFDWEIARRRALLQRVRSYETLYPGGARLDEALALELRSLFEMTTLGGGSWSDLQKRAEAIRSAGASSASVQEAAYYLIFCRRATGADGQAPAKAFPQSRPTANSRPAAASSAPALIGGVLDDDPGLLIAYREYWAAYPNSRYVPRMAEVLFEAAERAANPAEMRAVADRLDKTCPNHAITDRLAAVVRRYEMRGRAFWITFRNAADEALIDTRQLAEKPVLVVVWAKFDAPSCEMVRELEMFRADHSDLQLVGVNIDPTPADCRAAAVELGLKWPQWNDGRGWASEFLLEWGIRTVPFVLAIDRDGRLRGFSDADGWRKVAEMVCKN